MKTVRNTFNWLIVIVLLAAGAGGGYGYILWQEHDELLRQKVLAKIQETVPEWNIEIGRTRLDFQGRIRITDFKLRYPDNANTPLLTSPEIILIVDREKITEKDCPAQKIRLLRPHLQLVRSADGNWNWHGLPTPKLLGPLAEWGIEQATVNVRLEHGDGVPSTSMTLRKVDLNLIPSGKRQFLVKGGTQFDLADGATVEGQWNLETKTWSFGGDLKQLKVGSDLVDLLVALSPEFSEQWKRGNALLAAKIAANATEFEVAPGIAGPANPTDQPMLGVTGDVNTQFRISRWKPDAETEYKFSVQIQRGEVNCPLLAFPLYDLRGNIAFDNDHIGFQDITARNGNSNLSLQGKVVRQGELRPVKLSIKVQDLTLENKVRSCLSPASQRVYDSLRPSGKVDIDLRLSYNGRDGWEAEGDMLAKACTAMHTKFPYQVEQIEGTVKRRGNIVDLDLRGMAGQRPVTLRGRIKNPGPEAEAVLDIDATGIPLDGKFHAACPPPMQVALDVLRLQGVADGRVRIVRPAGLNQKTIPIIDATVRECTANCKPFPYALTNVSGRVQGQGDSWEFQNMKGFHDATEVSGGGALYRQPDGRMRLELDITALGAYFDQQLQNALPEMWQGVWKEFSPTGHLDALSHIEWTPGERPNIQIESVLSDASLSMKSFPYTLDSVQARVSLGNNGLKIKSFAGRHADTRVRLDGVGTFGPSGEWVVRLENMFVDDLEPDRRFRKVLPARLGDIIETLNPRGKLSLAGMLEFRGTGRAGDMVTAAWDLKTVYSGATITTGVDLENLHGWVKLQGTWDGQIVNGKGQIEINSLTFKGHQLTDVKGPLQVRGAQLVIGSADEVRQPDAVKAGTPQDNSHRVTARFIDGQLALDGVAVLDEKAPAYHVRMELSGGKLERYAQLYLPGRNKLMGAMNGWIDLQGRGASAQRLEGTGQLLISPAALYELPVIVSIFKILNFVPPDKTAFRHARAVFTVGGGQFTLKRADLVGDAINLVGKGTIRFDGPVSLDFLSTMGRYQLPIPIVREVVGEATKGLVGVSVRGTMTHPISTVRAVPQMDDMIRGFMGSFDNRRPPPQRNARDNQQQKQQRR